MYIVYELMDTHLHQIVRSSHLLTDDHLSTRSELKDAKYVFDTPTLHVALMTQHTGKAGKFSIETKVAGTFVYLAPENAVPYLKYYPNCWSSSCHLKKRFQARIQG